MLSRAVTPAEVMAAAPVAGCFLLQCWQHRSRWGQGLRRRMEGRGGLGAVERAGSLDSGHQGIRLGSGG